MHIDLGECPLSIWIVLCHTMDSLLMTAVTMVFCQDVTVLDVPTGCKGWMREGQCRKWTEISRNWWMFSIYNNVITWNISSLQAFFVSWIQSSLASSPPPPPPPPPPPHTHTHKGSSDYLFLLAWTSCWTNSQELMMSDTIVLMVMSWQEIFFLITSILWTDSSSHQWIPLTNGQ